MQRNRILFLAVAVVFSLCLFSCTPATEPPGETSPSIESVLSAISEFDTVRTEPEETETSETAGSLYPMAIDDSYGNRAIIEKEPMRIVSLAPNITELLFDLGAGEKLVGRTDYCNYPESALSIASVGSIDMPSVETIVTLDPDLIIASSIFTEASYEALTELGYTVVVFHEEYDMDGVKDVIASVGAIMDCGTEAQSLIEAMDQRIQSAIEKIDSENRPSVYYAVSFGDYGDYTAGGDTYVNALIEMAGGVNIASDITGWSYSVEKLVEKDPDIILVNEYMLADFMALEPYKNLSAVKNGQVFGINPDLIERQGFRNAAGIELLVSLFYPAE
ncbi:MAG: ABC transporter substrate-binding protein [Clostridiaceae bacterium]|nr:ABC transporter substrate-binding protein [Clostridiaceae bacterium]